MHQNQGCETKIPNKINRYDDEFDLQHDPGALQKSVPQ